MKAVMTRALNLGLAAVFSGAAAVAGIMMPASAEQESADNKTVVSRESWTGSYTVESKSYDYMTYAVNVYNDGSIEIKGQHVYNWTVNDGWNRTFDLGILWYDDSLYQEELSYTEQSRFLTTIVNYKDKQIGHSFTLFNDTSTISSGLLFDFTIVPQTTLTQETTIDVFGHEIVVSPNASTPTKPTDDGKDAKIAELEQEVARLQEQLSATVSGGTGDVNGDGAVNAIDATYILQYAAYRGTGGTLDLESWMSADSQESTEPIEPTDSNAIPDDPDIPAAGGDNIENQPDRVIPI